MVVIFTSCNSVCCLVCLKENPGFILAEVFYLECAVICPFTSDFQQVQPTVGRQWKEQPSFPFLSPTANPHCLTCLWLHNCEIHNGARGVFWMLELVIVDRLFCQPFLVGSCRVCHGAVSRDRNVDFAVTIQTTNLSASLLIFISRHLLSLHVLRIKYIYLQAFLTLILLYFLKFRMHSFECKNSVSTPWSQFWDILSTSGEQTCSLFPYKDRGQLTESPVLVMLMEA